MHKFITYTKILLIIFLIIGCEETEPYTEHDCDGAWVSSNKIN